MHNINWPDEEVRHSQAVEPFRFTPMREDASSKSLQSRRMPVLGGRS